jgi:hypothetical protein
LPPGLEKHLRRNGHLPPGLEKRLYPFPFALERRLPHHSSGLWDSLNPGRLREGTPPVTPPLRLRRNRVSSHPGIPIEEADTSARRARAR